MLIDGVLRIKSGCTGQVEDTTVVCKPYAPLIRKRVYAQRVNVAVRERVAR
jgi:hypothetical protein